MELMRIKDHGVYHRLDEHQKLCYRLGLPVRYLGHLVSKMTFRDYTFDGDLPKTMSSVRQRKWARETKKNLGRNNEINGIIGFHSSPTDEAAFAAAGSMFEGALKGGLSCRCVSATMIRDQFNQIPKADFYLIHGITDTPNPATAWAVRDFIRERDGSMRLVVMCSDPGHDPWTIIHGVLRMNFDVLLCLDDSDNRSSGSLEPVA